VEQKCSWVIIIEHSWVVIVEHGEIAHVHFNDNRYQVAIIDKFVGCVSHIAASR